MPRGPLVLAAAQESSGPRARVRSSELRASFSPFKPQMHLCHQAQNLVWSVALVCCMRWESENWQGPGSSRHCTCCPPGPACRQAVAPVPGLVQNCHFVLAEQLLRVTIWTFLEISPSARACQGEWYQRSVCAQLASHMALCFLRNLRKGHSWVLRVSFSSW